ncbi:M48 family metalloprotease [Roseibium aggregatum]|uniref:M48 family metalloprotease n=1 Tax=Roseibium aggregatum TaxID=187304 RepID=A0A926P6K2_9HYPH|nr:M48 family metalloprotease [Roseibium aggregatum]MBD1549536.1 M48 family metalloprotease [Roseibium aggregatum]
MAEPKLDSRNLHHSTFPTWLGLVFGSWAGLIWASVISAPIGIGFGIAAGSAFGGFLAVPIWGTVFGLMGLGRQRDAAVRQHGITLLQENDPLAQRVYRLVADLGLRTRPWVGVMPHANAYAIGANADNALVVVGQPLLKTMSEAEIDAIIGHELGHVANNDMRRMGLARSFQNSLVWYLGFSNTVQTWGRWFLTWVSELMVLGLSRKREYWADAIGAALTSKADMIAALRKIHEGPAPSDFELSNARLMLRGFSSGSMFSTHPTLSERVSALEAETYLRQLPIRRKAASEPLAAPSVVPKVEDIAYAKK